MDKWTLRGALTLTVSLAVALSGCGGGGGGSVGNAGPPHGSYSRSNPLAEDLLDHWNEPEQMRAAFGLSPVDGAQVASRTQVLTGLLNTAGGDPSKTGTKLRNVRPEDIEIVDRRAQVNLIAGFGGRQ